MKSWQIFFFTLIPLALVFMGVVGGSFDGVDSRLEESFDRDSKPRRLIPAAATQAPGVPWSCGSIPLGDTLGDPIRNLAFEESDAAFADRYFLWKATQLFQPFEARNGKACSVSGIAPGD